MAKTYTDWGDNAKHTISLAQHRKNVAAQAGGSGGGLPDAARVTARARKDPAFLARALKNPGLRSRITDINLLPRDLQQERTLNAPIFPGSGVTGRDLTRRATDETTAAYAAPEADLAAKLKTAQQHQGDVDQWWQQYQAAVNSGAGQIGAAQDQMVAGAQGVTQGIQGLGQAQIGQILDKAAATAGPDAAPSASLATEANRAQVSRETLAASYLAQAQQQAAASKGFAGYQAGVVAPAYRMLGRNETQRGIDAVGAQQTALATKKGADLLKTRADIRQQEIANTVALGQLSNQTTAAKTTALANSPAGKVAAAGVDVDKSNAVKAGVSLKTWQAMTPAQQARATKVMSPAKKDDLDKSITDPKDPFFGLTPRQIARHSQTWRDQQIKHTYGLTHPDKAKTEAAKKEADAFKIKYHVPLATGQVHKTLVNRVTTARTYVKQLASIKGDKGQRMTDAQIMGLLLQGGALGTGANKFKVPKQGDALAVRMAIELERRHGITGGTANMAHKSGYSIEQLGFPSAGAKPSLVASNTVTYGTAPAQPQQHY